MKNALFGFLLIFTFSGCQSTDACEDILCFTPPPSFDFQFIDKETGENLFSNGTFEVNDFKLIDGNGKKLDFTFISENDLNFFRTSLGWNVDISNYKILIDPDIEIAVIVDTEQVSENCCSFYRLKEFSIEGFEFEQSSTTGIYTVFI